MGTLAARRPRLRRPEIIDTPEDQAELLRRQFAPFRPGGGHAPVAVGEPPYGRMLAGIRGLRLHINSVTATFRYDDHNPIQHRESVARRLDLRAQGRDKGSAAQQRSRLAERGQWRTAHD